MIYLLLLVTNLDTLSWGLNKKLQLILGRQSSRYSKIKPTYPLNSAKIYYKKSEEENESMTLTWSMQLKDTAQIMKIFHEKLKYLEYIFTKILPLIITQIYCVANWVGFCLALTN